MHEGPRRDANDAIELDGDPAPVTYGDHLSNGLKVWLDVGLKLGSTSRQGS
jgi:hypothetical protein